MRSVLTAGTVLVPEADPRGMARLSPGWLAIDDARVVAAGEGPPGEPARDLGPGTVLAPGLVDLQVNGLGAVDFAGASVEGWRTARRALAAAGVTGFCPTLVTAPAGAYPAMLDGAARAAADTAAGADIVGVHLEGPFLGDAPGAHPVDLIRPADVAWLAGLLDAHPGLVRIVTLAPEADPGGECTRMLAGRGVVVALGHSRASFEQAGRAFDSGARMATHVFNGMGPLHHREPGLAGAALDDDRVVVGLIADLVHVHPAVVRLVARAKAGVAVVTDSVAPAAGHVGPVGLDGAVVGEGPPAGDAVRLPGGTLVGTSMTLLDAVANLVAAGVAVDRAVAMTAVVPARLVGLDTFGAVGVGGRADLVALAPPPDAVAARGEHGAVRAVSTWIGGIEVGSGVGSGTGSAAGGP